ncbi:MAG TPA: carotenoid oxygenase family protein [Polyangia bacterium]|nr:carotenoid oxygenase family protein [Polyangia bacterium]
MPWYPPVPESMLRWTRKELHHAPLEVVQGTLPRDLGGHMFMVAPAGHVETGDLPDAGASPFLSGDGMIYRFDFTPEGAEPSAHVTSRLSKSPCFYADTTTRERPEYARYKFRNFGELRFSPRLGLRDLLNTAFLPFQIGDEEARLLVTYDPGRAFEMDTASLHLVTPMGAQGEWRPQTWEQQAFPPTFTSAHPCYDKHTGELYSVNYGKSINSLMRTTPLLYDMEQIPYLLAQGIEQVLRVLDLCPWSLSTLLRLRLAMSAALAEGRRLGQPSGTSPDDVGLLGGLCGGGSERDMVNFTYLVRWDGKGPLERWRLMMPNGLPVRIDQTMHQIEVTRDYIVVLDTADKTGLSQIFNNPFPEHHRLEQLLRLLTTRAQRPNLPIYLVRRADLVRGERPLHGDAEARVTVRPLVIPLEAAHFLADYDNPNDQITLHIAHSTATDVAEWQRVYDTSPYGSKPIPARVRGMISVGSMDINRLGRYVIDGRTGRVVDSKIISDDERTWGLGMFAARDVLSNAARPGRIENVYWSSSGYFTELLSEFVYELYRNYPHRLTQLPEIMGMPAQEGRPSCLLRLDTREMRIADTYRAPQGWGVNSPQFVPRRGGGGGSTDGYVVCTGYTPEASEIWIFDAARLEPGPLCRLRTPGMHFGFSLHTAWLPRVGPRTASYCIPVQADYQEKVKGNPQLVRMFEEYIYPHFPCR